MDALAFARLSLRQVHLRLEASIDGLSDDQARWRPMARANSIAFILWHLARVEDGIVSAERGAPSLWERGWAGRLGHAVETPSREERETLLALEMPPLAALRSFLDVSFGEQESFLDALTPADLERPSRVWPGQPLATSLRHLITHKNNHHGQVDLLRGLQEEGWGLPAGTGVILDDA